MPKSAALEYADTAAEDLLSQMPHVPLIVRTRITLALRAAFVAGRQYEIDLVAKILNVDLNHPAD